MKMENLDFRTKAEKNRDAKAQAIVSAFRGFKESTGYSNCRIINAMAKSGKYGYTSYVTIYNTLKRSAVI